MKLPKHINLTIEHQPHASGHLTLEKHAEPALGDVTPALRACLAREERPGRPVHAMRRRLYHLFVDEVCYQRGGLDDAQQRFALLELS